MALILRKEGNANVTTPPEGSGAIFLSTDDAITVKSSTGNISSILTFTADTNTEVFFNDAGELGQSNAFTFDKSTGTLDVTELSAGNIDTQTLSVIDDISANTVTAEGISTTGNATIGGDLVVDGNITYINVETFNVEDPLISLGGGPNGDPLTSNDGKDRGLVLHYYDTGEAEELDAFIGWDNSNSEFGFGSVVVSNQGSTEEIDFLEYGNVRADHFLGNGALLTETLTVGSTNGQSNNFPESVIIATQFPTDIADNSFIGIVGQSSSNSLSSTEVSKGILGIGQTSNDVDGIGVEGRGLAGETTDTGDSIGVSGSAKDATDGVNIGILGDASGSTQNNYAFYVKSGDISSTENVVTWDLNANSNSALRFNSNAKTDIFNINTTIGEEEISTSGNAVVDGNLSANGVLSDNYYTANGDAIIDSDGISTSGNLDVTGIAQVGSILTDNYLTANGAPLDFQRPAGSNTQLQFNDDEDFGASVNLTFDSDTNNLALTGEFYVTGNIDVSDTLFGQNANFAGFFEGDDASFSGNLTTDSLNANTISVANTLSVDATANFTANTLFTGTMSANIAEFSGNVDFLGNSVSISGDLSADTANFTGNIAPAGILTDNYYFANGAPLDLENPAGSNNQIQFNDDHDFGASANLTFDPAINELSVTGTLEVSGNTNVGNIDATNGTFTTIGGTLSTNAQPNITSVGTLASLNVTGSISGGNISGTLLTGTLVTTAQPNITSVGTLTSLDVSNDITAANITANTGVFTGNGSGLSAITGANVTGEVSFADTANSVAGGNVSGQVSNALVAGTVYTNAQPNITSVGTLTSLSVSGNIDADEVDANLLTGTLTTAAQPNITSVGTLTSLAITGNASANNLSVTNDVNATTLGGTLTTAAQPNITSVGTLASLDVTGNASAGNISTAGTLSVTGNADVGNLDTTGVNASTLTGSLTTNNQPNVTSLGTLTSLDVTGAVSAGNISGNNANFSGGGVFGANVDMSDKNIVDLADPVNNTDAATKRYVDEIAEGLKTRPQVEIATTADLNATYNNGNAGVGATLTASSNGAFPEIDGVTLTSTTQGENGVLVKDQTDAAENGRYNLIQVGDASNPWILERCSLCDESSEIPGSFTFVKDGDTLANTGWVQTVTDPSTFVIGTDPIIVTQFSGAGTFTAGTGLTLDGTEFNINNAQPTITSVGTLTGLDVNGDITAANITANTGVFTGNGSALSSLTGGNVTGQVGNALVAGTVYTNAQPNITSVGTLTSLTVSGNASAGNLSTGGTLSVTGNANVGNIGANSGVFTSISGDGSALTSLDANSLASGTVPSGRLSGSYAISVDDANTAATVTTNAQPNITSVGTLTSLDVSGNANVGNVDATNFIGSGASLTDLNASNLASGTVPSGRLSGSYAISVDSATTAGTVTTAAQPNITSVGTLSSLAISGTNDLTVRSITTGANTTTGTIEGDWSLTAGSKLNATYADLAECYTADDSYEPGTVVVFGGEAEVTAQDIADNKAVAGVVSTNPAYLMNSECEGEHVVQLALIGRVPCKVIGPVNKGDLIVTSEQVGFAKVNNEAKPGTVIGKALENLSDEGDGLIEVLIGRC